MMAGWSDLVRELDRWEEAGRTATLWWRDDDAAKPTSALERLIGIAPGIPIALAVIPAQAEEGLAVWLAALERSGQRAHIAILQHGWRHVNHSSVGKKKSEFPEGRLPED